MTATAAPRVLHVLVTVATTSAPYNELCLPFAEDRRISVCTFRPVLRQVADGIALHEGDGTLGGFGAALRAALEREAPDVVHVHGPQVAAAAMWTVPDVPRRPGIGTVLTVHNTFGSYRPRNRLLLLPAFARFPVVAMCGWSTLASYPYAWRRLAGDRLVVVPNGVDISRVDAALRHVAPRTNGGSFHVAVVGRLIPRKDPLVALRAFASIARPGDRLTFVGDGELAVTIRARADALGVGDAVTVTGIVEREEVYGWVADADVSVSCSRGEGLPVAVLESMACRRPVVLSRIAPHEEIAGGDDAVMLFPAGEAAALSAALLELRDLGARDRDRRAERARCIVEERFSLEATHRGYLDAYARLLGSPAGEVRPEAAR